MTVTIDKNKALELLDRAVAEKGVDYVYPVSSGPLGCTYERHGHPSCIVGHVLSYVGLSADDLHDLDRVGTGGLILSALATTLIIDMNVVVDEEAQRILDKAQNNQDSGQTWGESVAAVRSLVEPEDH